MLEKVTFHKLLNKLFIKTAVIGIVLSQFLFFSPYLSTSQVQATDNNQDSAVNSLENADPYSVIHDPIYPDSYPEDYAKLLANSRGKEDDVEDLENDSNSAQENPDSPLITAYASEAETLEEFNQTFPEKGENLGYEANTLTMKDYSIPFVADYGNLGYGADFDYLNSLLDQNYAVAVGQNNIQTFFGHYYNLSNNGVFNPLADLDLLHDGVEVIVTDEEGFSKGYLITQTMEFLHPDQIYQYYGDDYMPNLAYNGNGSDMIYIQYCRWDISLGLLITNIGYRIW